MINNIRSLLLLRILFLLFFLSIISKLSLVQAASARLVEQDEEIAYSSDSENENLPCSSALSICTSDNFSEIGLKEDLRKIKEVGEAVQILSIVQHCEDWLDKLHNNGVVKIRNIGNQILLDSNNIAEEIDVSADQKDRISQIWRIRFLANKNEYNNTVIRLENISCNSLLCYCKDTKKLKWEKNKKIDKTPVEAWWSLTCSRENKLTNHFEIHPYSDSKCHLNFIKLPNKKYKLTVSKKIKNSQWSFDSVYEFSNEGWFGKVIEDWGQIIARRWKVDLLETNHKFNKIISHTRNISNINSNTYKPYSGGVFNRTENTFNLTIQGTNEKKSVLQEEGSRQGDLGKRYNQGTKRLRSNLESRDNSLVNNEGGKSGKRSRSNKSHQQVTSSGFKEREDNSDANAVVTNTGQEQMLAITNQETTGQENITTLSSIDEREDISSNITTKKKGLSTQAALGKVKAKDKSKAKGSQKTSSVDTSTGSSTQWEAGVSLEAKASGGIGGIAKVGAKATAHLKYGNTSHANKNTGNANTDTDNSSNAKSKKRTVNFNKNDYSDDIETNKKETRNRTAKTSTNENRNYSSQSKSQEQQNRQSQHKSSEKRLTTSDAKEQEFNIREDEGELSEQESELMNSYENVLQHKHQLSNTHEASADERVERELHCKTNNSKASSNIDQITNANSLSTQMEPGNDIIPHKMKIMNFKEELITEIYGHTGAIEFIFSEPLALKIGRDRGENDHQNSGNKKSWYIFPHTILNTIPVPHVALVEDRTSNSYLSPDDIQKCYYGVQKSKAKLSTITNTIYSKKFVN